MDEEFIALLQYIRDGIAPLVNQDFTPEVVNELHADIMSVLRKYGAERSIRTAIWQYEDALGKLH